MARPPKYTYSEEFAKVVEASFTRKEVILKMGWSLANASFLRFKKWVEEHDLDISHFNYGFAPGNKPRNKRSNEQVFVYGKEEHGKTLKQRMLKLGVPNECLICGLTEWFGLAIVLEVDHIDGDRVNNVLSNLRLLCPNCHSQTPTFRGKNIGRVVRTV